MRVNVSYDNFRQASCSRTGITVTCSQRQRQQFPTIPGYHVAIHRVGKDLIAAIGQSRNRKSMIFYSLTQAIHKFTPGILGDRDALRKIDLELKTAQVILGIVHADGKLRGLPGFYGQLANRKTDSMYFRKCYHDHDGH